jgi:hypothetical protein
MSMSFSRGLQGIALLVSLAVSGCESGEEGTEILTDDGDNAAQVGDDLPGLVVRPVMRLPFRCGQTMRVTTWSGHNPWPAADMNQGSCDDDYGKDVMSSAGGEVVFAGVGPGGYGNSVEIAHGDGWHTWYAHLSSITVRRGQHVDISQQIGNVGKSGGQDCAHLHYEQRLNGSPVKIIIGTSTNLPYYGTLYIERAHGC